MKNSMVRQQVRAIWGFKNSLFGTGAFLLFGLITFVLSLTGIGALVAPVFSIGYASLWLSFVRQGKISFKLLFTDSFSDPIKKWCLVFMTGLLTALWSLLFIIPGIVKSYAYAMAPYIMLDNPEIGVMDAITQSKNMMKGYKWKLFCIDFGFALLGLLAPLTLGLLYLDIIPRQAATRAAFYDQLKNHLASEPAPAEAAAE